MGLSLIIARTVEGYSELDRYGCLDSDGDGWSDADPEALTELSLGLLIQTDLLMLSHLSQASGMTLTQMDMEIIGPMVHGMTLV